MSRTSNFDRNNNLQINGGVTIFSGGGSTHDDHGFSHVGQRIQTAKTRSRASEQGFDIIYQNTISAALYGSSLSSKDAGCLHIFNWLNSPETEVAMWMYGPAGIGKTAIAQTVAKSCTERKQLSSTFFFFRSDEGRNSAKNLVPTLAYGMLQQMPYLRDTVCTPIANNPLIMSAPLEDQIKTIILPAVSEPFPLTQNIIPGPKLFIIDGLDECMDTGMQRLIIRLFISSLAATTNTVRHKILIVSRPESHIVSTFSAVDIARHVHQLCLDDWKSNADIKIYLRAELEVVKQTHPLQLYLDPLWPSDDSFHMLLSKSSESFAYASAAIRYISSHDRHPDTSLNNLLVLSPDCAYEAYAELDLLYHHILESIDPRTRYIVLKILCLYCSRFMGYIHRIGILFGEKTSTLELALIKMSSVIQFERHSGRFYIYHTSFCDFLRDKVRSGGLYVYSSDVATPIAKALMSRIWVLPVISSQDDHLLTDITEMIEAFDAIAVDMQIHILRAFIASPFPITLAMYRTLVFRIFFAKIDRGSQSKDHPAALTQLFLGAFERLAMWLRSLVGLGTRTPEIILSICFLHDFKPPSHIEHHICHVFITLVRNNDDPCGTIRRLLEGEETWEICIVLLKIYLAMPPGVRSADMMHSCVSAIKFPFFWKAVSITTILIRILGAAPARAEVCHLLEQIIAQAMSATWLYMTPAEFIHFYLRQDPCESINCVPAMHPINNGRKYVAYSEVPATGGLNDTRLSIAEVMDLYIRKTHSELHLPYISADVMRLYCDPAGNPDNTET